VSGGGRATRGRLPAGRFQERRRGSRIGRPRRGLGGRIVVIANRFAAKCLLVSLGPGWLGGAIASRFISGRRSLGGDGRGSLRRWRRRVSRRDRRTQVAQVRLRGGQEQLH